MVINGGTWDIAIAPINGIINGFTWVITSISGVITLLITGRGPPCINQPLQQGKLIPLRFLPDKHKHHVDSFLCELITFIT